MNNIFQLLSMMKNSGNPQQYAMNMINSNPSMKNNPLMQNALKMMQNGDSKGLETMARNLAGQNGIDINEMMNQMSNMLK